MKIDARKNRLGLALIWLGLLMIIGSFALAGYNLYDEQRASQAAQQAFSSLEGLIPEPKPTATLPVLSGQHSSVPLFFTPAPDTTDTPEATAEPEATPEPDVTSLPQISIPEIEIPDYVLNPNMDMPELESNGQKYIGMLEIPVLDLKLPVISQWSYPALKIAPCRYVGSAYTNDLVISAHNYQSHFGKLNGLMEGDIIHFTDADGNLFTYEVIFVETLSPYAIEEMTTGDWWDMTLFTCTVGGSYRVTVRCELQNRLW